MKRHPGLPILFTAFLLIPLLLGAQPNPAPRPLSDSSLNRILFPGQSSTEWERLFCSFDSLILRGNRTLNFLHIGDSHIQAGFLTETLNRSLTDMLAPGCGSRGFLFPYRMARSNNPAFYSVKYTGNWEHCRIVGKAPCADAGLAGFVIRTTDSLADMHLLLKNDRMTYDFNRILIHHAPDSVGYALRLPGLEGHYFKQERKAGTTEFLLDQYRDSLWIRLEKTDTLPGVFTLYGLQVDNGDPGLVFSIAGVNGAEYASFLNQPLFDQQLSGLHPDCILVSLGTNDAFALQFDACSFGRNVRQLIRNLRKAAPGVPILLTTPPDSYKKRKYDNKNLARVREVLIRIAAEENCAVWDLYSIMGGAASMMNWYRAGLTARDKVHFSRTGYELQGELLFKALRDAWTEHLERKTH